MRAAAPRKSTVGVQPASTAMGPTPPGPIVALETRTLMIALFPLSTREPSFIRALRTLTMDGVPTVFMPTHWNLTPTSPVHQKTTGIAQQLSFHSMSSRQTLLEGQQSKEKIVLIGSTAENGIMEPNNAMEQATHGVPPQPMMMAPTRPTPIVAMETAQQRSLSVFSLGSTVEWSTQPAQHQQAVAGARQASMKRREPTTATNTAMRRNRPWDTPLCPMEEELPSLEKIVSRCFTAMLCTMGVRVSLIMPGVLLKSMRKHSPTRPINTVATETIQGRTS